jgi:hypothetical protein
VYPQPLPRVFAIQPVLDGLQRDQAGPRASFAFQQLAQGQRLAGQVLSQDKGVSLVSIAGQPVAMRLPPGIVTGDTLKLTFAGHMPQPVFLLDTPESEGASAPQLSPTARMLSEIMQRVPERSPPTLTPPTPLLDRPTPQTPELALALRTALVRSGLFYESHLANWVAGQDNLDGLLQEPQNRLAANEAARQPVNEATRATATVPGMTEPAAAKPANPLHTLLTQQLQVLESPQFVWKGELWPGQPLEWQIRRVEDEAPGQERPADTDSGAPRWESSIRVTLPRLGTLVLHLHLDAQQGFSIRVVPEAPQAEPLLQRHQGEVLERLAAAGCTIQAFKVSHEPADA